MFRNSLTIISIASAAILTIFISTTIFAQVVVNEVDYHNNLVEIKNLGEDTVDISDWILCEFPTYLPISTLTVRSGSANLSADQTLVLDLSGDLDLGESDGEVGLYVSGPFGDSANIRSYVQWGSGGHRRATVAVEAGIWSNADEFVSLVPAGHSIEYDGEGNTPGDWMDEANPTLGEEPPAEEEEFEATAYGYATLGGDQEVPPVEEDAVGTAALSLDTDGNLYFNITVTGLSGPITGAHFHGPAAEGENAPVIFGFTEIFDGNYAEGVWEALTEEQLGYLMDGQLYLNVHTTAHPGGEIRGQVHMGGNGVAELNGEYEVPPVEVDAAGTGVFELMNGGTALWYNVTITGLSGPITGAHFHGPAAEGENAPVIFGIGDTFDGNHAEGVWEGLTSEQLQYLLDEQIYVNIHTTAHPGGEIRGQVEGLQLPEAEGENSFVMDLAPGLNMISLPLMPAESYTAKTFAEEIGATVVIRLDSAAQRFVGFTADSNTDGFSIDGGQGYIVNVPGGGSVTFTGKAWANQPAAPGVDVPTTAWAFVLSGDLQNAETGQNYTVVVKNRRTGAVASDETTADDGHFAAVWADLNRESVVEAGDTVEITLLDAQSQIASGPFRYQIDPSNIRTAYLHVPLTVGDVRPAETALAQNFPNPFNPETWLPYQLAESAAVTIQIYDPSGRLVRTLDLGLKPAGLYMTQSTAAYWDGRNDAGERVASGVYFYSLQTSDFTATRKMLIAK